MPRAPFCLARQGGRHPKSAASLVQSFGPCVAILHIYPDQQPSAVWKGPFLPLHLPVKAARIVLEYLRRGGVEQDVCCIEVLGVNWERPQSISCTKG